MVILISLILYLTLITLISYWAYRKKAQTTPVEFSLAGRNLGWLTSGLSAISTQFSAWLFLGWVGMSYTMGLPVLWLTIGTIPCVAIGWFWMAKRLRIASEEVGAITVTEYLSRKVKDKNIILIVGSLVGVVFMLAYVSAQLAGTGKILNSTFGIDYQWGVIAGAVFIAGSLLLGGYYSDCYTDLVQGVLMITSMLLLPTLAIYKVGGLTNFFNQLKTQPNLLSFSGGMTGFRFLAFAILMPWGQLVIFGMPHVMKRMMSMKDPKETKKTALTFGASALILHVFGLLVGLSGRVLLPPLKDAEQCFPLLAANVFPPVLLGLVTAGMMAAIMSSADSQLLYAATEIANNLYYRLFQCQAKPKTVVKATRLSIIFVALTALALALKYTGLVFSLVVFAAAGLTCCFGPAVLMSFWKKTTKAGIIAGMIIGPLSTIIWKLGIDKPTFFNTLVAMPLGFVLAILSIISVSLFSKNHEKTKIY